MNTIFNRIEAGEFFAVNGTLCRYSSNEGRIIVYIGRHVHYKVDIVEHPDDTQDPLEYWVEQIAEHISFDVKVPYVLAMRVTVMKWANELRRKGMAFGQALRKAILAYQVKDTLEVAKELVVKIFSPQKQEEYTVTATRSAAVCPATGTLVSNQGPWAPVVRYFDLNLRDYRSFRVENLVV